jgi:mRNA interferase MazF
LEKFVKGDVVILPFPFSDLSSSKKRPALVLADLKGDDIILCQITSKNVRNSMAISLKSSDFIDGSLRQLSNIRPDRIFTADKNIVIYKAGRLNPSIINKVVKTVIEILTDD